MYTKKTMKGLQAPASLRPAEREKQGTQKRVAGLSYTNTEAHAPQRAPLGDDFGSSIHAQGLRTRFALYRVQTQRGPRGPPLHAPSFRPHSRLKILPLSFLNHAANAGRAPPCFPQRRGAGSRGRSERAFAAPRFVASASCTLSLSGGACACAQGSSLRSGLWVLVVLSAGTLIRFVSPLGRRPALGVPHPGGRHPRSRFTPRCVLSCLCSASISLSERVFCRETAAA